MFLWMHLLSFLFSSAGGKKKNYACFLQPQDSGSEWQQTLKILKGAYADWGLSPISIISTACIRTEFSEAVFFHSDTLKKNLSTRP